MQLTRAGRRDKWQPININSSQLPSSSDEGNLLDRDDPMLSDSDLCRSINRRRGRILVRDQVHLPENLMSLEDTRSFPTTKRANTFKNTIRNIQNTLAGIKNQMVELAEAFRLERDKLSSRNYSNQRTQESEGGDVLQYPFDNGYDGDCSEVDESVESLSSNPSHLIGILISTPLPSGQLKSEEVFVTIDQFNEMKRSGEVLRDHIEHLAGRDRIGSVEYASGQTFGHENLQLPFQCSISKETNSFPRPEISSHRSRDFGNDKERCRPMNQNHSRLLSVHKTSSSTNNRSTSGLRTGHHDDPTRSPWEDQQIGTHMLLSGSHDELFERFAKPSTIPPQNVEDKGTVEEENLHYDIPSGHHKNSKFTIDQVKNLDQSNDLESRSGLVTKFDNLDFLMESTEESGISDDDNEELIILITAVNTESVTLSPLMEYQVHCNKSINIQNSEPRYPYCLPLYVIRDITKRRNHYKITRELVEIMSEALIFDVKTTFKFENEQNRVFDPGG